MLNGKKSELALKRELKTVTEDLAALNRELAAQMIMLAAQTEDTAPLIHAVEALRSAQEFYSVETTPRENADVQQVLGDTLLKLGRAHDDVRALEHSITAYRGAITIASMLGDEDMRRELKLNYGRARNLLAGRSSEPSLKGVA